MGLGVRKPRYCGRRRCCLRCAPISDSGSGGPSPGSSHETRGRLRSRAMTPILRTRLATRADAAAIAAIYNEGIADRIATFETEPRTPEQLLTQLTDKGDRFPTVVVESDGRVVAWASAGPYRSRPAYAGVAEHSVYVG